ncbi:MAG TPA: hypothetical protein PKK06_08760, partial [Phycisphaerae bacterium]|nr:hypothetical protein [Phycisphaerae bacterium]HNU45339.1 hypothetical protein [Phycisphaerae bacterium]
MMPERLSSTPSPRKGFARALPGKLTPDDPFALFRRQVKLVAQVSPPIPGVTVYFRVWDVDDPFDQLHGPGHPPEMAEIPGVEVIDNDRIGNDNRGGYDPAVGTYTANTDADGYATVIVTVSMQPGNNYRACASCLADAIQQATQAQADALSVDGDENDVFAVYGWFCGYQVPVVWSRMLTVWRKLHVETDSMWAVPTTVIGREPDWQGDLFITSLTVNATTTTLHLAGELSGQSAHQYEGGRLVLDNGWSFRVWDHALARQFSTIILGGVV